ncbi:integrase catalytic domain-containing protein [Streptomyces sp. CB01580]|uniref:integrase catalytic domain-containing protein n=1 Tax=Streptomyces sp. CB01580 TaxID=1703933 RepID=UPI00093D06B0|nr:DDE-type integrase/transposase/recombinase [Streptomyces sp. CB01580]
MYRILSAAGQNGEHRRQVTHPPRTILELVAHGPAQVFTWDITRLPGPAKGIWVHAYVIIDVFSRCIVGHTVERAETAEQAEELIRETIELDGVVPHTVHVGRGTSMTCKKVSQAAGRPRCSRSRSRPSVSDENPFSEGPQTAGPGRPSPERDGPRLGPAGERVVTSRIVGPYG